MNTGASGFRSIGVEKVTVQEDKQLIGKVVMTSNGPQAVRNMDPYSLQQAETMSTSGGVSYEDFTNVVKVSSVSSLGNDASSNLQVNMKAGAWTMLRKVDFGTEGAQTFTLKASGSGTLEIRLQRENAKPAVTLQFNSTSIQDHTFAVDPSVFKGVKTVYFIFTEASNVKFDAWRFNKDVIDGVKNVKTVKSVGKAIQHAGSYDLMGRRLQDSPSQGVYVKDGKKYLRK